MGDRCQACGKLLSSSRDSATLCVECRTKMDMNNASAFPFLRETGNPSMPLAVGEFWLTKREWFAGMAMQGILADHTIKDTCENVARGSVKLADSLMKELSKKGTTV